MFQILKKAFIPLSLISGVASALTPFTISGLAIEEMFKSEKVWQRLGGPVDTIQFKGHTNDVSTYWITLKQKKLCLVEVDVTNTTPESLAPTWKVSRVDASACPSALPE